MTKELELTVEGKQVEEFKEERYYNLKLISLTFEKGKCKKATIKLNEY